jgi:rhamnopyranosyl-N-acetylglucosaminyl-diphospho-decaprenol beta-1,3/1,4-galactofuranosyltransferase
MPPTRIFAVVVTFRRPRLLAEALDALARQSQPLAGIVVVDNGGDAETAAVLAARGPLVILRPPGNEGGAAGFAYGLTRAFEAGADAAWVLDDDCVPASDALARLVAAPLAEDAVRALAPCSAPETLAFPHFTGRFDPRARRVVIDRVVARPPERPARLVFAAFLGLLVPRAVFARVGPPLAPLFSQLDDVDWCYRAQEAGFEVWLVPEARAQHPATRMATLRLAGREVRVPVLPPDKLYYYVRNRVFVNRTHQGLLRTMTRTVPLEVAGALARGLGGGGAPVLARAIEGVVDGLAGRLGPRLRRRRPQAPRPAEPPSAEVRRVAAVVVTHERPRLLERLIAALRAQDAPPEIVVVDNASGPETGALLAQAAAAAGSGPRLRSLRNERNDPPAAAFGLGMRAAFEAGADAVWLMDDDCEPFPDALAALLGSGVAHTDRVLVSMPVLAEDPRRLANPMSAGWLARDRSYVRRRATVTEVPRRPGAFRVLSAPFNGVLVGRAVFERMGPPDATVGFQGDDKEYCLRAWASGFEVLGIPASRVRHPRVRHATRAVLGARVLLYDVAPEKRFFLVRNNLLLAARYYPFPAALGSVLRIAADLVADLLARGRTAPLRSYARGAAAALALIARGGARRTAASPEARP